MMKSEFEKIAGYEITYDDYKNIIEPMYLALNLEKKEFVKLLNKKRFAVSHKQNEDLIRLKIFANEIADKANKKNVYEESYDLYNNCEEYCKKYYKAGAHLLYADSEISYATFPVLLEIIKDNTIIDVISLVDKDKYTFKF